MCAGSCDQSQRVHVGHSIVEWCGLHAPLHTAETRKKADGLQCGQLAMPTTTYNGAQSKTVRKLTREGA